MVWDAALPLTRRALPPAPAKTPTPTTPHLAPAGGKAEDVKGVKGAELCPPTRQSLQSGTDGKEGQLQRDAEGWITVKKVGILNQERVSDPQPSAAKASLLPGAATGSEPSEKPKPPSSAAASFEEPPIPERSSSRRLFEGCSFGFVESLPMNTQSSAKEVIQREGGVLCESSKDVPTFTIGSHLKSSMMEDKNTVSYHWLIASVHEGKILDPSQHVIFRPLTCQIPLPGFPSFLISVSLYSNPERDLMQNLSYCLGAKVTEKLTRSVTHLLCPYAQGEKYKAATVWGIKVVKVDWLFSCVSKNCVVPVSDFQPHSVIDGEELLSPQYPTQAAILPRSGELGCQTEPSTQGGASQIHSLINSSKGLTGAMNQRVSKGFLPPLSYSSSQHITRGVTEGNNNLGKPSIGKRAMLPPRPFASSGRKNDYVSTRVGKSVTSGNSIFSDFTLSSEFAKDTRELLKDEDSVSRITLKDAFDQAERVTGVDAEAGNSTGKLEHVYLTEVQSTSAERLNANGSIIGAQEPNALAEEFPPDVADVISKVLMHMFEKETEVPKTPCETCDPVSPDSIPSNERRDPLGRHLASKRQKTNTACSSFNSEPEPSRRDDWSSKCLPKQDDDYEQF